MHQSDYEHQELYESSLWSICFKIAYTNLTSFISLFIRNAQVKSKFLV